MPAISHQAIPFHLDPGLRRKIEQLRREERDSRIYARYSALLWLDEGRSIDEVALLLGRDPSTIRKWLKLYEKKG
jgi:hypothetical protein